MLQGNFVYFYSGLLHCVSVSEGYGSVFHTLLVDGDAVRSSDFILSSVSFPDGSVVVVLALSLFGKLFEEVKSDFYLLFILFDEREDCEFHGSDLLMESYHYSRFCFSFLIGVSLFVIGVNHRGENSSGQPSGRFDAVREVSFSGDGVGVLQVFSRVFLMLFEVVVGSVGDSL